MSTKKVTIASAGVVTLGTVLAAGLGAGHASACSPDERGQSNQGSGTTAGAWSDGTQNQAMRMKLDAALREHAAVGVAALKADFFKEPDALALKNAVETNNMQVADAVEGLYPGTHDDFLALWKQHIVYYEQYLMAAQQNDETGKQTAKNNLAQFVTDVTNLLSDSNNNVDTDALQTALTMHGDQVTSIIDSFAAGNYDQAYTTAHEAYEHMGEVATLLADSAQGGNHHDYSYTMNL